MAVLVPCRGNNFKYSPRGAGGANGFYRVTGLNTDANTNPILITGVDVRDLDIVMPVVTLENSKILYTFGSNFGELTVNGSILMGKGGGNVMSLSLNTVIQFFQKNRSSQPNSKAVTVTGPGKAWNVFFTGLIILNADPQFNIQPFSLVGNVAEPNK